MTTQTTGIGVNATTPRVRRPQSQTLDTAGAPKAARNRPAPIPVHIVHRVVLEISTPGMVAK